MYYIWFIWRKITNQNLKKKKLYGPFLWMRFNCLKATATPRRQFTFYHSAPRNSWYSFCRPRKDERLSRPWSHPVVLNTGTLDWESSALTTWPLLHCFINKTSLIQDSSTEYRLFRLLPTLISTIVMTETFFDIKKFIQS